MVLEFIAFWGFALMSHCVPLALTAETKRRLAIDCNPRNNPSETLDPQSETLDPETCTLT